MPWYFGNSSFLQSSTMGWMRLGIVPLLAWSLLWKGLALWHAARRSERLWFVVLLVVNTVGILELTYLLLVAKMFRPAPQKNVSRAGKKRAK